MELKGDEERIEAFRRGDREILRELYEAYCDEVEQMLRGGFTFTSDGETVRFQGVDEPFRLREMVQDAFLHAFRDRVRNNYDPSRSFRPYLMTVIRNHMIDRFRRESLESDLFVAPQEAAREDESGREAMNRMADDRDEDRSPEAESMRRELASLLRDFIDDLDDRDREILEDYMIGDASQHAMADRLDVSRHTVRKRIREIRVELLGELKREGFVGGSDIEDVLRAVAELGIFGGSP